MKNLLAVLVLASASTSIVVGVSAPTTIGPMIHHNSRSIAFKVNGQVTGGPACAKSSGNRFVIPYTEANKTLLAGISLMRATGEGVVVVGTGTCDSLFTDSEVVEAIRLGEGPGGVR